MSYVIINSETIKQKIEELENQFNTPNVENISRANELKEVLSISIPLIPEIESAFNAGCDFGDDSANMDEGYSLNFPDREEYIEKLKLPI